MKVAIKYAPDAWNLLNGIFCIYKPAGLSTKRVRTMLLLNLVRDFDRLKPRPPRDFVKIEGSAGSSEALSVITHPSYSDHPLVVGPRYQVQDFQIGFPKPLGRNTSGVLVMAVNEGNRLKKKLEAAKHLRTYHIKGKFGYATDTYLENGKILEKATYGHISHSDIDRAVSSIQCAHQAHAYKYAGVELQSQTAYELASRGIIRPEGESPILIYSIKCIQFELPNFTLEIHCINEEELYLMQLVHDLGLYLKSCAVCTQIRQIRFGYFTLDHALLRKHWTLEHILNNIHFCKPLLDKDKIVSSTAYFDKIDKIAESAIQSHHST